MLSCLDSGVLDKSRMCEVNYHVTQSWLFYAHVRLNPLTETQFEVIFCLSQPVLAEKLLSRPHSTNSQTQQKWDMLIYGENTQLENY